jgi:hypothetical protein
MGVGAGGWMQGCARVKGHAEGPWAVAASTMACAGNSCHPGAARGSQAAAFPC